MVRAYPADASRQAFVTHGSLKPVLGMENSLGGEDRTAGNSRLISLAASSGDPTCEGGRVMGRPITTCVAHRQLAAESERFR